MQTLEQSKVIGYRYELAELIGHGGMGAVFKAYDRLTDSYVALKRVALPLEQLSFKSQKEHSDVNRALASEFRTLASLRHPNIISVLDFGFHEKAPYYTMEVIEGGANFVKATQGLAQVEQIKFGIQMLQAVAYLHRRGVLHRDLKPDNVLVVDGQVKVMDFGLAVETRTDSIKYQSQAITGTIGYMSPEIFAGKPVTRANDLWAVGVILYEVMVGTHPFDAPSMAATISAILHTHPDLSMFAANPKLTAVFERLLAKSPDARYSDANEVIQHLGEAVTLDIPVETQTIRESYLRASRFIGREREVEALDQALNEAVEGSGSGWLLSGESGVGKSRLIEELRVRALTHGMLVLTGRAVPEQQSPYQIWVEALRHLCLRLPLSDLEVGILKAIIPDVERLTGRSSLDVPPLEGTNAQLRLHSTVESMFRRNTDPVLLILEDLQWAQEGVTLARHLSHILTEIPAIFVGSFRSDEAPNLTSDLPQFRELRLHPLDNDEIEKLSTAIIGPTSTSPELMSLLQRETEGNALYLIEVLRTLADRAGRLDLIGKMTLPSNLLSDGLRTPILRRLATLPPHDIPLMQLAAVMGRFIDLSLLAAAFPDQPLDGWLLRGADAHLFEVSENHWRFTHEKVRDVILEELPAERRIKLHQQIAELMEQIHGITPMNSAEAAFHWLRAIDPEQPDPKVASKAIRTQEMAAQFAMSVFAYIDADKAFNQLIETTNRYRNILAPEDSVSNEELGTWHIQRGFALNGQTLWFEAADNLRTGLDLLGITIPKNDLVVGIGILGKVLRQVAHRLLPALFVARHEMPDGSRLQKISFALGSLAFPYFITGQQLRALWVNLHALNLSESAIPTKDLATAYANMSILSGVVRLRKQGYFYKERAFAVAREVAPAGNSSLVSHLTAIFHMNNGEPLIARSDLDMSESAAHEAGDVALLATAQFLSALTYGVTGDFEGGRAHLERASESAIRIRDIWRQVAVHIYAAHYDYVMGKESESAARVQHYLAIQQGHPFSFPMSVDSWALAALIHLHFQNFEAACEAANTAYHNSKDGGSRSMGMFSAEILLEVYLALKTREGVCLSVEQIDERLKAILKTANAVAAPAHVPIVLWMKGTAAAAANDTKRACEHWRQGARQAQQVTNPLVEGRCYLSLAQHLPRGDSEQTEFARRAREVFTRIGARHYLTIVDGLDS